MQEIMRSHAFHQKGSHLLVVQPIRQVQQLVHWVIAHLGIAAQWRDTVGHPVPSFEASHPVPNTFDDPNTFEPDHYWLIRHWPWMRNASAMIGIGKVHTNSRML